VRERLDNWGKQKPLLDDLAHYFFAWVIGEYCLNLLMTINPLYIGSNLLVSFRSSLSGDCCGN
jgi:hypothetical protein